MHRADEILLHAGFAKTGTTAIQRALLSNKDALLESGALWPGREDNHYHLLSIVADNPGRLIQIGRLGLAADSVGAFLDQWRADFAAEIEQARPRRIILSTEYLNGASEHELRRLRDFLGCFGRRLRVMAYVRDPWSMSIALTQQGIRNGSVMAPVPLTFVGAAAHALDFFSAAFGQKVEARPYSKDAVSDFAQWADLDLACPQGEPVNKSSGLHATCVIAEMNRLYPGFDTSGAYIHDRPRQWMVESIVRAMQDGPRIEMSRRTAIEVERIARDSLEDLRRRYFHDTPAFAFDPDTFPDIEDDTLHLGRLSAEVAGRGLLVALRALSERGIHYFDAVQRALNTNP